MRILLLLLLLFGFNFSNAQSRKDVSPQLAPSCNNIIDLRPLSKIKYTHDEGKRNAKTLR
jgi:hypothetical protein